MNNPKSFSVYIDFYYDGIKFLDPRLLTTFKSALTLLRKIPSCVSIDYSESVYKDDSILNYFDKLGG